ncbi:hypothetical protein BGZ65_005369 [Modicella reniformis]|uniref:Uncharacterized protein n=1 Tax=Modicella reniformis TaxID=1440133 RepID=A0A9P6LYI2_9FUNG|nr:hypothetical protein BGZ65_005369 [Modicella reniformis]
MASNNNSEPPVSDQELELRLAKLRADLALRFSRVFGQSPAAAETTVHLDPQSTTIVTDTGVKSNNVNGLGLTTLNTQRTTTSYTIPVDSDIHQDMIDTLFEEFQDDLGYLDELDNKDGLHNQQNIQVVLHDYQKLSGQQELESVTDDLERKLSKYLQADSTSPTAFQNHSRLPSLLGTGEESEQERAFGDQLDRLAEVSLAGTRRDDDEMASLIQQASESAQLEAKYGNLEAARLRELNARHEELKKGTYGLSSVVQPRTTSQDSKAQDEELGPPPAVMDLDELRSGGSGGGSSDDNPDNWCCKLSGGGISPFDSGDIDVDDILET